MFDSKTVLKCIIPKSLDTTDRLTAVCVPTFYIGNDIILLQCDDSSDGTGASLLRENYGVKTLVRSTDHQSVLLSFGGKTIPIAATTSMKTTTIAEMNTVGKAECGAVRPIPR